MNRWTYRTLPANLADTNLWRTVEIEGLEQHAQQRFKTYQRALTAYLATGKLNSTCLEQGVNRQELIRLLNRCVSIAEDGRPFGWLGLLKHYRICDNHRTADLPAGFQDESGNFTGSFTKLLEYYPGIKADLDILILKKGGSGRVHQSRISAKDLHDTFLTLCANAGIKSNQYPFNSISQGLRSIERYMERILLQFPEQGVNARFGETARSHLNVGRGIASFSLPKTLLDTVGLDPHEQHCIGSIRIPTPKGLQRIAISRLWIVPVVDDFSRAILGYSVGIRKECSSTTIEQAIISAMSVWAPRDLRIPGMRYKDGAGFPSYLFPESAGCGWVTLMIDNAAIHFAKAIAERARQRIGCFVNYGPVGHWEHRAALERVMKTLETYGFQNLPSSTGKNSTDPVKKNPAKSAVDIGIDWKDLLDLIDVECANYNITNHRNLGNCSPLEIFRSRCKMDEHDFLPRRLPPASANKAELGVEIIKKTVRGNYDEGRRPYLEIDESHYTSPIFSGLFSLIGKDVLVHVRESDMRTITAYYLNGEKIGVLTAQGAWGQVLHTKEMRKEINALRRVGKIHLDIDENPVNALLRYYASTAYKETEKKPYKISRSATKYANTMARSGRTLDVPVESMPQAANEKEIVVNEQINEASVNRQLYDLIKKPVWKSRLR